MANEFIDELIAMSTPPKGPMRHDDVYPNCNELREMVTREEYLGYFLQKVPNKRILADIALRVWTEEVENCVAQGIDVNVAHPKHQYFQQCKNAINMINDVKKEIKMNDIQRVKDRLEYLEKGKKQIEDEMQNDLDQDTMAKYARGLTMATDYIRGSQAALAEAEEELKNM